MVREVMAEFPETALLNYGIPAGVGSKLVQKLEIVNLYYTSFIHLSIS